MASMSAYSQPQKPTPTSPVQESRRCQQQQQQQQQQLLQLQHMQMQMQMQRPIAQMHSSHQPPIAGPSPSPSLAQLHVQQQQQQLLGGHSQQYRAPQSPVSPLSATPTALASAFAPTPASAAAASATAPAPSQQKRKRKAESQDAPGNERLSKRLSLLNLERNGPKLYVPVEAPVSPALCAGTEPNTTASAADASTQHRRHHNSPSRSRSSASQDSDHMMQLDDSRHKVYIYNLDDELSSSESEPEDGRLIMLPDVNKHLLANRIPPSVKASPEGQLAGMQLVLYREPRALTVPEADDSVRKAVVEARQRIRNRLKHEAEAQAQAQMQAQMQMQAAPASASTAAATTAGGPTLGGPPTSAGSSHTLSPLATSSYDTPSIVSPFSQQQQAPAYAYDAMDMDVDMDID